MRALPGKLRPVSGFAHYLHLGLITLLPLLVYMLVRIEFYQLALLIILLSKWRIFAVKPRYWPINVRYNAVDLMVSVSLLAFMIHAPSVAWQLVWTVVYEVWLVVIKPGIHSLLVGLQAFMGQAFALVALFLVWPDAPLWVLIVALGVACYLSARHYLGSFDERYSSLYAGIWGYFAAALVWVLGHWLLFYGSIAQPTLILTVLGFGLGGLYYLDQNDRLSNLLRRQFIFIMVAVVVVILVFSDWSDKSI